MKMPKGKRYDNKGRLLHTGEGQDSSGRYYYKYTDNHKKRRTVYSWRLVPSDTIPYGKRKDRCLRDKIKEIERELYRGTWHDDTTVCEQVERYLRTKTGVRKSTKAGYKQVQRVLAKEPFGKTKIYKVRVSDAKLFFIKLQQDGRGYSNIHTIRGVLRPAFQMAVDDDMLIKNPFDFQLSHVIVNDSVKRVALSEEDEQRFLKFLMEDKHYCRYYEGVFLMLNTGLRISEFCGLTWKDIDFQKGIINVDHQLICDEKYSIEPTKTTCGNRQIPMTEEVKEALQQIRSKRKKVKVEPMVDGYSGFLFLDKNGNPRISHHWQQYLKHAVRKYNRTNNLQLPVITPHICRHTFCSKMARAGMSPKALQYLMGHGDIRVTMNVYTHVREEDAKAELIKMGLIEEVRETIIKI